MSSKFTHSVKFDGASSQNGSSRPTTTSSELQPTIMPPDSPVAPHEFTTDDAELALKIELRGRNARQHDKIKRTSKGLHNATPTFRSGGPIFQPEAAANETNPLLGWAYAVAQVSAPYETSVQARGNPLGVRTPQPRKKADGTTADPHHRISHGSPRPDVVLFNVLVALEWSPTDEYLRNLEWAVRRASDYLYDVTDGRMAFGQVIFAGVEWMDCADIQIMASNRFHPRSWVNGLHDETKYLPIRVGRGYWFQRNRVTIPWDEPEAYRVLVHEWAHYALNQKDAYLQPVGLGSARALGLATDHARLSRLPETILIPTLPGIPPDYTAVVHRVRESSDSIMATTLGTSELVPHARGTQVHRKGREWAKILEVFPGLQQPDPPLQGPGRLPLPLPQFGELIPRPNPTPLAFPAISSATAIFGDLLPKNTPPEQCWLYSIKDLETDSPRLIAQGTLDAQAVDDGLSLLGAAAADTIVLIKGRIPAPSTASHQRTLESYEVLAGHVAADGKLVNADWRRVTPDTLPRIDVIPHDLDEHAQFGKITIRIDRQDGQPLDTIWIFPLGQSCLAPITPKFADETWQSEPIDVPTLDGHILASWGAGADRKLMITSFSQGGCPPSGGAFAPVPITAGSSDGQVMLFFHDPVEEDTHPVSYDTAQRRRSYSRIKVVTTITLGARPTTPYPTMRPMSYPFSLASNKALPAECYPTLAIHYDTLDEIELLTGDLVICRLMGDQQGSFWEKQPTYIQPGSNIAVTPLTRNMPAAEDPLQPRDTAPLLLADLTTPQYYQLFWIPRGDDEIAHQV